MFNGDDHRPCFNGWICIKSTPMSTSHCPLQQATCSSLSLIVDNAHQKGHPEQRLKKEGRIIHHLTAMRRHYHSANSPAASIRLLLFSILITPFFISLKFMGPVCAMVYLEDPLGAINYDSLPSPPPTQSISKWPPWMTSPENVIDESKNSSSFNFNYTYKGELIFKMGTPEHYLTWPVTETIAPAVGNENPSSAPSIVLSNAPSSTPSVGLTTTAAPANATTDITNATLFTQNNATTINNVTTNVNQTNSSLFKRSLEIDSTDSPTTPSPTAPPSITSTYSSHAPPYHPASPPTSSPFTEYPATYTYLDQLTYFNDMKLIQDKRKFVYYDSRQARFGLDLGPRGNAEFVNLVLPPRLLDGWESYGTENYEGDDEANDDAPSELETNNQTINQDNSTVPDSTEGESSDNYVGDNEMVGSSSSMPSLMPTIKGDEEKRGLEFETGLFDNAAESDNENATSIFDLNNTSLAGESQNQTLNQTHNNSITHSGSNNGTLIEGTTNPAADANHTIPEQNLDPDETIVESQANKHDFENTIHISDYFCLEDFIKWRTSLRKCSQNKNHRKADEIFNVSVSGEYNNAVDGSPKPPSIDFDPCPSVGSDEDSTSNSNTTMTSTTVPSFSPSFKPLAVESARPLAVMVRRGRCSFESKAQMAVVLNNAFASSGKSNRIDHIIIYNNGTDNDNYTETEEELIEMSSVTQMWNEQQQSNGPEGSWDYDDDDSNADEIQVGLLYLTTHSEDDLLYRIKERESLTGVSPYLDVTAVFLKETVFSWRTSTVHGSSTKDDEYGTVVHEDDSIHDPVITHGWFFPATLTRFCLSCGLETDYGFASTNVKNDDSGNDNEGTPYDGGPTHPRWDHGGVGGYTMYTTKPWVEVVRRLMIAILVLLLAGPVLLAAKRWFSVGGTVRIARDENGARRFRIISPNLEVFVNGVPGGVEPNGTKLDRSQVFALPEVEYDGAGVDEDDYRDDNNDLSIETENYDDLSVQSTKENDLSSHLALDSTLNESGESSLTPQIASAQASPSRESCTSTRFVSSSCCSICLSEFVPRELLRVLPRCDHIFHTECILPWLTERQGCCPMCKTPVLPEELQRNRGGASERDVVRRRQRGIIPSRWRIRRERRSRPLQSAMTSSSSRNPSSEIQISGILFANELENDLVGPTSNVLVPMGFDGAENQLSINHTRGSPFNDLIMLEQGRDFSERDAENNGTPEDTQLQDEPAYEQSTDLSEVHIDVAVTSNSVVSDPDFTLNNTTHPQHEPNHQTGISSQVCNNYDHSSDQRLRDDGSTTSNASPTLELKTETEQQMMIINRDENTPTGS